MTDSAGSVREHAATQAPWTGLAAGVALIVAFRIPAFLEPRWYSDESTYAYVGRTVFGGGVLYRSPGAWDNKPPVQYWTYGIVTHFLGYTEAAIHLVPFVSAIASVIGVGWGVARLTGSRRRAAIACVLAALLIGPPIFDSELFLPEGALIGPMTWAGMLMLVSVASPWWAAQAPLGAVRRRCAGLDRARDAADGDRRHRRHRDHPAHRAAGAMDRSASLLRGGAVITALWLVPTIIASGVGATWFAIVAFYGIYAHNSFRSPCSRGCSTSRGSPQGWSRSSLGRRPGRTPNPQLLLDALVARGNRSPRRGLSALPVPASAPAVDPLGLRGPRGDALESVGVLLATGARGHRLWLGAALLAAGMLLAAAQGSYAGSFWINGRSLSTYYADGYSSLVNGPSEPAGRTASRTTSSSTRRSPMAERAPLRQRLSRRLEHRGRMGLPLDAAQHRAADGRPLQR